MFTKKSTQNRERITRVAVTRVRYRNSAKTREPAISIKIKGKKYTPVGKSRQPRVSDTAAASIATTGPKTMAPSALMKKAMLIFKSAAMGIPRLLSATRRAIIRAANTRIRMSFSSMAASRQ